MVADLKKSIPQKMQKTLEALKTEFSKVRSGRAHPGLLDQVLVDYYGASTPISQLATVTVMDARTLSVAPWEKKSGAAIEKAIRDAGLGLNPAAQGDHIRIPMPALTEERRRDLTKVVRTEAEQARVAIRNIRRDANQQLKEWLKEKEISEDDDRRAQDDIQKMTSKSIVDIDQLLKTKEEELMAL